MRSALSKICITLSILIVLDCSPVLAQSRSGFGEGSALEGGDSVTEDIHHDDISAGSIFRFPGEPLKPWFDTKRRLNEKYGLKLNFSYQALYQEADISTDDDEAAAGRGEINGSWILVGRGTKNTGRLTFRLENRTTLGTNIPPTKLGNQFGSGTLVGTGFSDFGSNLSELGWRQSLLDGNLRFVFGKISAVSWYGGHAFSSPKRGFQNTAILSSNTRAFPGRGIGGGIAYRFTPNYVALVGIHDANAKTTEDPFDTIDQKEFLQSFEFRWYTTTAERARWDQVRLNLWHQDTREQDGVPESYGMNLVASKLMFNDKVMPFLLAGVSDGNASLFRKDIAVGVGFGFNTTQSKARDVLAGGIAWGDPSDSTLQEQITGEVYYRFQLLDNIAITPSIQVIKNPVANPDETTVAVAGLRFRVTF